MPGLSKRYSYAHGRLGACATPEMSPRWVSRSRHISESNHTALLRDIPLTCTRLDSPLRFYLSPSSSRPANVQVNSSLIECKADWQYTARVHKHHLSHESMIKLYRGISHFGRSTIFASVIMYEPRNRETGSEDATAHWRWTAELKIR